MTLTSIATAKPEIRRPTRKTWVKNPPSEGAPAWMFEAPRPGEEERFHPDAEERVESRKKKTQSRKSASKSTCSGGRRAGWRHPRYSEAAWKLLTPDQRERLKRQYEEERALAEDTVGRIITEELPKLPGWFRKKGVENTHDVEDLAQATIETFRQRVYPDRPAGAIAKYLYRCAESRLVDHWRKLAVEQRKLVRKGRGIEELREVIQEQEQDHRQAWLDLYQRLYGGGNATLGPLAFYEDGGHGSAIGPCVGAEQRTQIAMREILETADKVLAPRQLEAFNLCYLAGHTQVEAAEIMGCTPQSVQAALHNAKRKLRRALGDDFLPWVVQEDARVHEEVTASNGSTEDE